MGAQPNVASTAFLFADPGRAAMLTALLDGRARPAGELAHAAGVTAQTASSHLSKLLAGGLLAVQAEGRHRYYRLASPDVAQTLENLAALSVKTVQRTLPTREAQTLRFARCCYDHLAGRLGVRVTQGLQAREFLVPVENKQFVVTPSGAAWFNSMGLDITKLNTGRRGLARQCLDSTEREHHLAGPLGAHFMSLLCSKRWLRRSKSSRAVEVTPLGWAGLRQELGIRVVETDH